MLNSEKCHDVPTSSCYTNKDRYNEFFSQDLRTFFSLLEPVNHGFYQVMP